MPDCLFLARCISAFDDAEHTFHESFAELEPATALRRPGPKGWSVAECLEHLNVAVGLYLPGMEKAIRRGRRKDLLGRAPFERRTLIGRMLLFVLDPERPRRVPAPGAFRPSAPRQEEAELHYGRVGDRFVAALGKLRQAAETADGLDLDRLRLPTPLAPFPRLTLAEAFEIHTLHIPRHLTQAQNTLAAVTAGSPPGSVP